MTVYPVLLSNNKELEKTYRIALGDITGNIQPRKTGNLKNETDILLAGLNYEVWTRDSAINIWNGFSLIFPKIAENTLLANLSENINITGQYWDSIIWVTGAWYHYLFTGNKKFLAKAFTAATLALTRFNAEEFDPDLGLYRGPACYGDGISAYPDIYAQTKNQGDILTWPGHNKKLCAQIGYGIPMYTLSTNCLYYNAWKLLSEFAKELGKLINPDWQQKASDLYCSINKYFWNNTRKEYKYIVDQWGGSNHQEGLGNSFAILFNVADKEKTKHIIQNQHITMQGIPCVYPTYERYKNKKGTSFGRHSGTIWPHIMGFWTDVCAQKKYLNKACSELKNLQKKVLRDHQFAELYHPQTGLPYGGMQEWNKKPPGEFLESEPRQTWSATAYFRMITSLYFGMRFNSEGIFFESWLPKNINDITFKNLYYQKHLLSVSVKGSGNKISSFKINNINQKKHFLPKNIEQDISIAITVIEK